MLGTYNTVYCVGEMYCVNRNIYNGCYCLYNSLFIIVVVTKLFPESLFAVLATGRITCWRRAGDFSCFLGDSWIVVVWDE